MGDRPLMCSVAFNDFFAARVQGVLSRVPGFLDESARGFGSSYSIQEARQTPPRIQGRQGKLSKGGALCVSFRCHIFCDIHSIPSLDL